MTLVVIDPDICPACTGPLVTATWTADALFRHGGYGASVETVVVRCRACGWALTREVRTVRS